MKSRHLILVCSLALPLSGKADWTVVQEVNTSSATMHQTNRITLKIKGNKTRIDTSAGTSVIKDNDSGDQFILMHAQKRYVIQSASQLKEGMEQIRSITSRADTTPESIPQLEATGKTEEINGYGTEEFVWKGTQAKGRYWVAKDFPHYADLLEAMENSFAAERKLATYPLPDTRKLPGFPIRSEQIVSLKAPSGFPQQPTSTNVVTLISVKEEVLGETEFAIPKDYSPVGTVPNRPPTNAAAGLRDVMKQMEKQGLSEDDRKKFEQIIKNAEGQTPKAQK
jgi:hypothetical protein